MRTLANREAIDIRAPRPGMPGSTHDKSMHTMLFRWGCYLEEALEAAVERAPDPADLKVISAGCSNGAELDSVLSHHRTGPYEGRVRAIGCDVNALALRAARRGMYAVIENGAQERREREETLREAGFAVRSAHRIESGRIRSYLVADSEPLRQGNDVSFRQHDLREPLVGGEGADLVLVNNVLYHMDPNDALKAAENLAEVLAEGGVISFGGGTLSEPIWWTERTVNVLDREFGLEPIMTEETPFDTIPVMFARH